MPLTEKGEKILANMEKQYGAEKGKQVLYAAKNKGTISGIDAMQRALEEDCADQSPHELGPEHPQLQQLAEQEKAEPWHNGRDGPLAMDPDMVPREQGVHDENEAPLVMPPDPNPREQGLEHPQNHPDASTPPSSADQPAHRSTYGSITGGVNPFGVFGNPTVRVWGDDRDQAAPSPRAELANPSLTLSQIQKDNEAFWRPHGVAPGPFRDRRR